MFLSKEVLKQAFEGLAKIDQSADGKKRQEMVSALRYFLASAELMNELSVSSIDLSLNHHNRKKFSNAVGNVVSLGGSSKYSNNFLDGIENKSDFGTGSNFLTTIIKSSNKTQRVYPSEQRNAPLLKISNWSVELHDDYVKNLNKVYNLSLYIAELYIWLCRSVNLTTAGQTLVQDGGPSNQHLADAIMLAVDGNYGSILNGTANDLKDKIVAVLDSVQAPILSQSKYDFVDFNTNKSSPQTTKLISNDPILIKFNKAFERGERNFLFFGAPGTGKTWYAEQIPLTQDANGERTRTLQFHPSISYDDFVEGYVSELNDSGQLNYVIKAKHFVQICEDARTDPSNIYFLIIDEFSRGDPARVLGEMLTYIENSYRGRNFQLIYSEKQFSVPENLVIIATANPFDRSVSELDDALLRRFSIFKFDSDVELLKTRLGENGILAADVQKIKHFFEIIVANMSIGFGHAHFFNVHSLEDLKDLWETKLSFIIQRNLEYETEAWQTISSKYEELFGSDAPEEVAEAED